MFQRTANLICFLFVMLMLCPIHSTRTGKDVFIPGSRSIADNDSYQCGRNLTLSCKFKKNTIVIVWTEENTISPIARCVQNVCSLNPSKVGQYSISFDKIQCSFNLTVINLNIEDNGRELFCSDGANSDSRKIKVRDYKPRLFEYTSSGLVKGTSGCIFPETNVTFRWFMVAVNGTFEKEIIPGIVEIHSTNCSKDSECGNNNHIQYSEIINASANDKGHWHLKVEATYGIDSKDSCISKKKYILVERVEAEDVGNRIIIAIIVIVLIVILTILSVGAIVVCIKRTKNEKRIKLGLRLDHLNKLRKGSSLISMKECEHEKRPKCQSTTTTSEEAISADDDEKILRSLFSEKDIINHTRKDYAEPVERKLPSPNLFKTESHKSY